jgi:uncharacterized YigZ family protein
LLNPVKRRLIPAAEARSEIEVLNSRFVACAAPAFSVEQAREFVARIKREFADATHHVPAYLIGHGSSLIAHCHDDGEPSGTAGRPALAVLQGSGLGDIVVVVARYFGGTKLGTGGLVRAYGDAVRSVLEALPRAVKVLTHTVSIAVPYALFERTRLAVAAHGGQITDTRFGLEARITARFSVEAYPAFESALQDLSAGTVHAEILDTLVAAVPA